jgi:hypothetical protein
LDHRIASAFLPQFAAVLSNQALEYAYEDVYLVNLALPREDDCLPKVSLELFEVVLVSSSPSSEARLTASSRGLERETVFFGAAGIWVSRSRQLAAEKTAAKARSTKANTQPDAYKIGPTSIIPDSDKTLIYSPR